MSSGGARPGADVDLLVIGDCNPDVVVMGDDVTPAFGQQEKLVDSASMVIGGSASIMAVAAARLGLRVALVAAVGADAAGEFMIGRLAAEGVDTTGIVIRPDLTTALTVVLAQGSDRAILTAAGAMSTLTSGDVSADLLARARHLHVSSYFLLEQSLGPGLAGLFAAAHEMGATTSLDTNWDPAERWGDGQLRAVLAFTDVLLPNEAEALGLSGASDLRDAVRALTAAGPKVVVKLGSRGALSADGSDWHEVGPPGDLAGPFIDAIGAGDCCNAGVIAGLLRGMNLAAAACLGCAVGSASTSAVGGTGARTTMTTALALAQTVAVTPSA